MRKFKKIAFVIGATVLFGSTSVVQATPRADVYECGRCGGYISVKHARTYEHDESFPCGHGYLAGIDMYEVYEINITEKCDGCTYKETYSYTEHIFKYCNGH